jgi:SET domain-containing protein
MFLVKTKLNKSAIEGIGLFADQFIPEGMLIWRFSDSVDQRLTPDEIHSLPSATRSQIEKYSYREKHSGLYVLCGDDARFFNHSADPNCIDIYEPAAAPRNAHDLTFAFRDISPAKS